jgi:dihydroorotate dehydrogenase (NAD+) catalytic subunit
MEVQKIRMGEKEVMPFTIPSGIVMTEVSCAERLLKMIPELGIWTTKSIGPEPRAGNREPILAQYYPGCFVNAVGLTNPGAEEFAKKLYLAHVPEDRFVLASIFGKNADEFVYVAGTLEELVDGFELNLSCPHCSQVGMALGQDSEIVREITEAVASRTRKLVFAKLTPNTNNIGDIARAAMEGGAYGISAINTIGPGYYSVEGFPVLTNKVGGLSGRAILPVGLKCVREIRQAVGKDVPIIGIAGIATTRDVRAYFDVGANIVGIGSGALAGMNEEEMVRYFSVLPIDLRTGGNVASTLLKKVDMSYRKVSVARRGNENCDLKVLVTDSQIQALPGQFVFAWIPGIGEKPFSVMDDSPLTLGVLEKGQFTREINSLQPGDKFYVRGPYGQGVDVPAGSDIVLVGGGCGLAGLHLLAKRFSRKAYSLQTFLGAKDKQHLPYFRKFEEYGKVDVATEDGSSGLRGMVTDLFSRADFHPGTYFFNCGPRAMVEAVLPLELKVSRAERIYSSVDYMTRCGVGLCGSCADDKGRRSCVEGPFLNP